MSSKSVSSKASLATNNAVPGRACPLCGGRSHTILNTYSVAPWSVVRCNDCTFVFLLNPPDYDKLEEDFAWEKTFVAEAQRRKQTRPAVWWLDRKTRWRLHMLRRSRSDFYRNLFKPGRVLDVGCGDSGGLPPPFIPYGIEVSRALFEKAKVKMAERGGQALFGPGAEMITEFPDRFFTGVIMSSVVEHEKQPRKLLENVARVLEDSGVAYIRVPNFGSINRAVMGANWCGFRHPDHVNYFTVNTLRRMAAECGLRLRLLHPIRIPVDDNINAVLEKASG